MKFHEADWDSIRCDLQEDLKINNGWDILAEMDSDVGLEWFYNKLFIICERHVPQKKASTKRKAKIPYHCRKLWKRIQKLQRKLKVANTMVKVTAIILEIKQLERNLLEDTIKKDMQDEKSATERIKKNSKAFYAFA